MSIESVMPSNHLILCRPLLLSPSIFFSASGSFPGSSSHQGAKVLEFQLQYQSFQWTFFRISWSSLHSTGLSRVFSNTTDQKHHSLLETCKPKLQWDINSHQSEWPSSKRVQTIDAGTLLHCWRERKLIHPLWKTVQRFSKTLWIKPPYDPAIPLLGIYPEESKTEKDTCIPLFIAALLNNS